MRKKNTKDAPSRADEILKSLVDKGYLSDVRGKLYSTDDEVVVAAPRNSDYVKASGLTFSNTTSRARLDRRTTR